MRGMTRLAGACPLDGRLGLPAIDDEKNESTDGIERTEYPTVDSLRKAIASETL
jgi:hypothetical protein